MEMLNFRYRSTKVAEERKREGEGGKRKGHALDMHHCSRHSGQFIKIIKPSLVLKVEPTIKLTETE